MENKKFFYELKEKISLLENETDKEKMRNLIIDVIVDLEKFCHRPNIDIHRVLVDARERCKKEMDKPDNK